MFLKLNKLAIAAIIGIAAWSGAASAMPVTTGPQTMSTQIVPAQYIQNHMINGGVYWQSGRDGNRCRTRYGNCRHYYQGYYYQTPWWTLPLIIGNTIANGNHGRSHVQWCLSRYRSYNPRTDLWLGNSGRHYRCNSPY
jgi:hypothetical protein